MRKVAYLYCMPCAAETLFVLYEPTESGQWDEHLSECVECGYSYGYIDLEPTTVVSDSGEAITTYAGRPVLTREVLEGGMRKLQEETAKRLVAAYGTHAAEKGRAMRRFRNGMADARLRPRLLNSTAPGLRKPS